MNNAAIQINSRRLDSIDAARGFAMFWYLGGTVLFIGLAQMTGNQGFIEKMTAQMNHAPWHGLTFSDIFFPFFLFISGMTFPMSLAKRRDSGTPEWKIYLSLVRRAVIMILLGFVYNGLLAELNFDTFRCYSVLARLGVSWALAAVIYMNTKNKWVRTGWFFAPLLAYWIILSCFSAPDYPMADRFSIEGNIAGYIDRTLFPDHLYNMYYDPEGLLGFIPSVSTAFLGILSGHFISDREYKVPKIKKALFLLVAGVILIALGLLWNNFFPINKRLWSSSFVCITGGISFIMYTFFYYVVEVCGSARIMMPFTVLGANSIAAYCAYKFIDFSHTSNFLFGGIINRFPEECDKFFNALGTIVILWFIFYMLYRKKVYIKI